MYCSKCGAEINDEAVICPKCGCETGYKKKSVDNTNETLRMIAKIFMLLSTIAIGFLSIIIFVLNVIEFLDFERQMAEAIPIFLLCIIPLAWCISMTVHYWKKVGRNEPVSTAFKVCTLIFVNTVSGILMLCDNGD